MSGNIFNLSDQDFVVAAIDPQLVDNAAVTSDWASLSDSALIMFILNVGATDITLDAKLQSAEDAAGTNAADITGKVLTQITALGDNQQFIIGVRAEDLANTGHTHVAMVVTVGDGTLGANVSAVGIGQAGHTQPFTDLASVAEIVN